MTTIYRTDGHLKIAVPEEKLEDAKKYLTEDDMTQYVDPPLSEVVASVRWDLHDDGYHYHVEVITSRPLTESESKEMSSWISGQNSDGLGEGFEQHFELEEDCEDCYGCGAGWGCDDPSFQMCSFDWETNDSTLRVV